MKKMKKIVSVLLAMVMVFAMTTTAFAAKDTTHTITITNETKNHTYEAYQVFVGNITGNPAKLTDLDWGSGVNGEELLKELKSNEAYRDCVSAKDVAGVLEGFDDNSKELDYFAKIVVKHLTEIKATSTETESPYSIQVTGDGYYFIKDKDNSVTAAGDSYTKFMLRVVKDVEVAAKDGTVISEKKVDDKNDSNTSEDEVEWQDSADYDIGDDVPFQLKATLPPNYSNYSTYKLTFHDKESKGLTFDEDSVKVYIDGQEISSGFRVVTSGLTDDCTFEVHFDNLKETAAKNNSVITVEYTSKLNALADLGMPGNSNTMHVTYSNNPNDEQGGEEGKTPDDTVIVFTYETIINKVDNDGNALTGAEFILEKKMANGTWEEIAVVKNDAGTIFTFTGLDDGLYRLTETTTPAGYNTIDPIYFEITAEHEVSSDNPALTRLSATQKKDDSGAALDTGVVATFAATCTSEDGTIESNIVNQSGATLPETGGMGTTLFYIIGSILVLGAVVVMITRKRMSTK